MAYHYLKRRCKIFYIENIIRNLQIQLKESPWAACQVGGHKRLRCAGLEFP